MATFNGTSGADTYAGTSNEDTINGNGGNDSLNGGANAFSADLIAGNAGADTIDGGDGDDVLFSADAFGPHYPPTIPLVSVPLPLLDTGTEVDILRGGAGDDRIWAGYGDQIDGGDHDPFSGGDQLGISFIAAPSAVTVDFRLSTQTIGTTTITGIEHASWIQGSNFSDWIDARSNFSSGYFDEAGIYAAAGNDTVIGGLDTAAIYGEDGNDFIDGRTSNGSVRQVFGGAGDDIIYNHFDLSSLSYVDGGDGNDTIYANNTVRGGNGDDSIYVQYSGRVGIIYGDAGNDLIDGRAEFNFSNVMAGGDGADTLIGTRGADKLFSGDYAPVQFDRNDFNAAAAPDTGLERDIIAAGDGNDTLAAGYGDDVDGGAGNDRLSLSLAGAFFGVTIDLSGITGAQPYTFGGGTIRNIETLDRLTGSAFADSVTVGTQSETLAIDGGNGDDVVTAGGSAVEFAGGAGNDRFVSGSAADRFDGGAGIDIADYSQATSGVTVSLAQGSGGGDTLIAVEQVVGSAMADTLSGASGTETLSGGAGNDMIEGGAGADSMTGNAGDDSFVVDHPGDQVIEAAGGGSDSVSVGTSWTLGAGQEIESATATGLAAINLTGNELGNRLTGNGGANALSGQAGSDTLSGLAGNDSLDGGTGDDQLDGGTGHDPINGGEGADSLSGGDGNDHLYGQSANGGTDGADTLNGGDGSDYLQGNAGNDVLDGGEGSDRLNGGADNDAVRSGNGNDTANGNRGNDSIQGEGGNDSLRGGQDDDSIAGDAGNDLLSGDLGIDTLSGGAGTDYFLFGGSAALYAGAAADRVTDFEDGTDRLQVGYAVQAVLTGAAQPDFVSAATLAQQLFDGRVGVNEVAAIQVGSSTYVFYSSNNGATADSAVELQGIAPAAITTADFS